MFVVKKLQLTNALRIVHLSTYLKQNFTSAEAIDEAG